MFPRGREPHISQTTLPRVAGVSELLPQFGVRRWRWRGFKDTMNKQWLNAVVDQIIEHCEQKIPMNNQTEQDKRQLIRPLNSFSMLNPPANGDLIRLNSGLWEVKRGAYGWLLHRPGERLDVHPCFISDQPDGMIEFIDKLLNGELAE